MRARVLFLSLLSLSLTISAAHADKARAKELYKRGMARYTLEKYDDAIKEFELGYQEEPDPAFLYNIAQSHRLASRPKLALDFYAKFLKKRPDAPNRAEIEEQIAALEKTIKQTEAMPPGAAPAKNPAAPAVLPTAAAPETAPVETKPVPVETKPVATKPAPVETKPVETPPTATEPAAKPEAPSVVAAVTPSKGEPARAAGSEIPPGARLGAASPPSDQVPAAKKKTWPIWVGVAAGVLAAAAGGTTAGILLSRPQAILLMPENLR